LLLRLGAARSESAPALPGGSGLSQRLVHHTRFSCWLVDDDLLREPPQPLVLPVAQLGQGHIDSALVVRDHHARESPRSGSPVKRAFIIPRVHTGIGLGPSWPQTRPPPPGRAGLMRSRAEQRRDPRIADPTEPVHSKASVPGTSHPPLLQPRSRRAADAQATRPPDDLRQTDLALDHRRRVFELDPTFVESVEHPDARSRVAHSLGAKERRPALARNSLRANRTLQRLRKAPPRSGSGFTRSGPSSSTTRLPLESLQAAARQRRFPTSAVATIGIGLSSGLQEALDDALIAGRGDVPSSGCP